MSADKAKGAKEQIEITVFRGVEGLCIAIDGHRIAGPKPWGGGRVLHHWKVDAEELREALRTAVGL